jgi:thiamine biosynthesis lipoprotein
MEYSQKTLALGSTAQLTFVCMATQKEVDKIFQQLWHTIFSFERQFSRFLPGSELSIFNRNSGIKQPITPEFRDILLTTRNIAAETQGLYNPFILPALQAAGYKHSRVTGFEHDAVDNHIGKSVAAIDQLEISDTWARIPYGTALDIGGCGKGYLAEQLRHKLPATITGYWLSFGGDIAMGGHDSRDKPWKVTIQSAHNERANIGTLTVRGTGGVATSGTTVHRGKKAGKDWHHIIDPFTLQPAKTNILLATVWTDSALKADVLASCAVILGDKKGLKFLKEQGATAAVLQSQTLDGQACVSRFGNGIIIDNVNA